MTGNNLQFNNIFNYFSAGSSEIVDQDSLDGQLPSSARSIVHDNPSGITPSPTDHRHHGVPEAPAPPPGGLANFTKGPGAAKKRHRKLNPETEDTMSEDEPSPPPPPSKSVSPRGQDSGSGGASSKAKNSVANSSTKAGSAIHLNPFSGVLWERREPL